MVSGHYVGIVAKNVARLTRNIEGMGYVHYVTHANGTKSTRNTALIAVKKSIYALPVVLHAPPKDSGKILNNAERRLLA